MNCVLAIRKYLVDGHFYGTLYCYRGQDQYGTSVQLTHKISGILEARALNRAAGIDDNNISAPFYWKPGMETNQFFTKDQVIEKAKEVWKDEFTKASKLVIGTPLLIGYEEHEEIATK